MLAGGCRTHPRKVVGQETPAEKGGVDAVGVVALAYDIKMIPQMAMGVPRAWIPTGGLLQDYIRPSFTTPLVQDRHCREACEQKGVNRGLWNGDEGEISS